MEVKIGAIVSLGIMIVGLIFIIVGLATTEWAKNDNAHFGLWRDCGKIGSSTVCVDIPSAAETDTTNAVRAMIILAMLASLGATATGALYELLRLLGRDSMKAIKYLCVLFGIGALVLVVIGVVVFALADDVFKFPKPIADLFDFGYSFALTIVGGILSAVGSVIFVSL